MLKQKTHVDFYNELRGQFPKMESLDTWKVYDWSEDGNDIMFIMTELAQELARWVADGERDDVQTVMDIVELYFHEGNSTVTSFLYTDFLVTVMEAKKEDRDVIKSMMKPETVKHYSNLFNFYREA
ncbi:MAG: hypothetical protein REI64_11870 [Pedobacter sp.]|uniref:DUF7674 family protein n=2 Tax=Bacteroidota TaxID=976 RepID=UPI00280822E0|nr:hypothetical protein [Pedobacter sp.]MDQ8005489.1 hypothetical protein [Pedobacter sp.]